MATTTLQELLKFNINKISEGVMFLLPSVSVHGRKISCIGSDHEKYTLKAISMRSQTKIEVWSSGEMKAEFRIDDIRQQPILDGWAGIYSDEKRHKIWNTIPAPVISWAYEHRS